MNNLKRILLVLTAAAMTLSFCACSEDETTESVSGTSAAESTEADTEDATEAETEQATIQAPIPQEYDGTEVPDAAAQVISDYFTAIMNQDYNAYKACLDPYYFEVYNSWLDGSFGYGMETSFEGVHQNVMNAAVSANGEQAVTDIAVTKLVLAENQPDEGEEMDDIIDSYLAMYDNAIGEGFTEEIRAQCDDIITVKFTMFADCDGKELEIMTEMEMIMTVYGDAYKVIG